MRVMFLKLKMFRGEKKKKRELPESQIMNSSARRGHHKTKSSMKIGKKHFLLGTHFKV